ncbi:MAG: hypothetical protein J7K31_01190, partial [Candidatus Aenigmarchaeota archaeon]|nr:hypothetical protein [Candidatus Aenigmarchaeota archaeon]
MKNIYLLGLVLIGIIFVSGYIQQTQEVTCNPPYIKVESGCCLDSDNNNICDRDEKSIDFIIGSLYWEPWTEGNVDICDFRINNPYRTVIKAKVSCNPSVVCEVKINGFQANDIL